MAHFRRSKLAQAALLSFLTLGIVQSCSDTEPAPRSGSLDDVQAASLVDGANEDLNGIALEAMAEISQNQGGIAAGTQADGYPFTYTGKATCSTNTIDFDNQIITIDFGEGCTNNDGKFREGQIEIHFTDYRNVEGAVITTSSDNFKVENIGITGTRTLTNTGNEAENEWSYAIRLEDGVITFQDGSTRTFEGDKSRTWKFDEQTEELTITETGKIYGTNRLRLTYNEEITTPLLYKGSCAEEAAIPVSGAREITIANQTFGIDYGSGDCDKEVLITWPNGEEQTFVISD